MGVDKKASREELENKLKKLKEVQQKTYSDFIHWSIQKSIDGIEEQLKELKE